MLKAPFRFDVEYFSIIMLYRNMPQVPNPPSKRQSISVKKHVKEEPSLLIFIFDTKTDTITACRNQDNDIPPSLATWVGSIYELFKHIRHNCDSEDIRVSMKGNLLIKHNEHRVKVITYPLPYNLTSFEELWNVAKEDWYHRKDEEHTEATEIYSNDIVSATITHSIAGENHRTTANISNMEEEKP